MSAYPVSDLLQAELTNKLGKRDAVVRQPGQQRPGDVHSLRELVAEYLGEYEHGGVDAADIAPLSLPELAELLIDLVQYIVVRAEEVRA